eukprot:GILI01015529.1.p1 GENE.GILI01015529.1~~GILI01015529.1.p1  ORF type:complete len:369 (-),score=69.11 GILI01015529.1:135-1241(-)
MLVVPEDKASDPNAYPPLLPDKPEPGQRFRLVVHIYKSTTNYCIDSTILAVQECYDSIAVKELMQYIGHSARREAFTNDDFGLLLREEVANGKGSTSLDISPVHTTLALAKLQANLNASRFLTARKWSTPTTANVSEATYIYHNPTEPIDAIVVGAYFKVDESTGVVSYTLHSSWAPRYDEETRKLKKCIDVCIAAIANTKLEMEFVSLVAQEEFHPLTSAHVVLDRIAELAKALQGPSADLRYLSLRTTPRLSAALFSQYVESFCGVLSEMTPSLVVRDGNLGATSVWTDFAWERHETTQQNIGADNLKFYIVCGVHVGMLPPKDEKHTIGEKKLSDREKEKDKDKDKDRDREKEKERDREKEKRSK